MLASLPMYDFPELASASADWWAGLRRHFAAQGLSDLPQNLTQGVDNLKPWPHPQWRVDQR